VVSGKLNLNLGSLVPGPILFIMASCCLHIVFPNSAQWAELNSVTQPASLAWGHYGETELLAFGKWELNNKKYPVQQAGPGDP